MPQGPTLDDLFVELAFLLQTNIPGAHNQVSKTQETIIGKSPELAECYLTLSACDILVN